MVINNDAGCREHTVHCGRGWVVNSDYAININVQHFPKYQFNSDPNT